MQLGIRFNVQHDGPTEDPMGDAPSSQWPFARVIKNPGQSDGPIDVMYAGLCCRSGSF